MRANPQNTMTTEERIASLEGRLASLLTVTIPSMLRTAAMQTETAKIESERSDLVQQRLERRLDLQSRQISWLVLALEYCQLVNGIGSPPDFPTQ